MKGKRIMKYLNLIDLLEKKVFKTPEKVLYTFLQYKNDEKKELNLTYRNIYDKARSVAVYLKKKGIKKGDRVIIFSSETYDNIYSIFGTLFAGAIFTLIPPPVDEGKKQRFTSVLESSGAKYIFLNSTMAQLIENNNDLSLLLNQFNDNVSKEKPNTIEIINVDECTEDPEEWIKSEIDSNTLAYLQYSSGSTSNPKGVMISHKNVLHNLEAIDKFLRADKCDTLVSWVPFFHNIGLIGVVFLNVYSDRRNIIMPTATFLEKPIRWFQAISEYKAEMTIAPNSAYNLCTKIINDNYLKNLDLSSLNFVINGSEVINYKDIAQFSEKFEKCGFRASVICPAYGLAESTCAVTMKLFNPISKIIDYNSFQKNLFLISENNKLPQKEIVSVGKVLNDMKAIIVDSSTNRVCEKNEIGELWVKSDSIGMGYWDKPEETQETFKAVLEDEEGYFLRTGDLGIIYEDELYISGRIRDVIIINGHNVYPQDIEFNLKQHIPILDNHIIVSFSTMFNEKERVILCIESDTANVDFKALTDNINKTVHQIFEFSPYDVVFVKSGSLPRTDNGKIRLFKVKELYESNELDIICNTKSLHKIEEKELTKCNEIQHKIKSFFKEILKSDYMSLHDSFLELGGDSFDTVQLVFDIEEEFGIKVDLKDILKNPSILGISEYVEKKKINESLQYIDNYEYDLYKECQLPEDIRPEVYPNLINNVSKNIFLTGSTGFVGAHLIKSLIEKADVKIYCHVRAKSTPEGFNRIKNNMKHYECWNENYSEKIVPVLGDLTKPLLGIEESNFNKLAEEIDIIYHNGALLNFMFPYNYLKRSNVFGTIECLRLACKTKAKHFHYISTFSVYDNPSHFKTIAYEDDKLESAEGYFLGYSETKWVSEKLVRIAEERGLKVSIYRPGDITGGSYTGIWDVNDLVSRVIVACIQMKAVPDMPVNIFYTPVDFVSDAIAHISLNENAIGKAFNLININIISVRELANIINEFGYDVKLIPYDEWQTMLINSESDKNVLKILDCLFLDECTEETSIVRRYSDLEAHFDISNTLDALKETNIVCQPANKDLIFKYLQYFEKKGYIRKELVLDEMAVTKE